MLRLQLLVLCVAPLRLWAQETGPVQAFCNDRDVEDSVDLALVTFNKKLQYGHQFALYRILSAFKAHNESGTSFTTSFEAKESDCVVGVDKVWKDCEYQPNDKKPLQCNATVQKSNLEGKQEVIFVDCLAVEPKVVAERGPCLGCPENIDIDSEDVKGPLMYSLVKFNAEDDSEFHFVVNEIGSATRQVVAGLRYDLQFEMVKSNCSKTDFKELTDECHPVHENKEFAFCNSTVFVAPWRHEEPETHINCKPGRLVTSFVRRRPPGWSPLRSMQAIVIPPTQTAVPTLASPEAKEESSEESKEKNSPPPSPAETQAEDPHATLVPLIAEPEKPFHCPSKPWKVSPPKTIAAPQQISKPAPEEGDFSDLDLL
ncbi:kininogen precursor-like [Scleropages formosus]|uniref:Kininogen-like n=1 Tax=Scleropages formosus TaxID=113540 RepID=A0A0P7V037_SCLFO|nr:kininogen precursor-like [Scleropages formosus]